MGKPPKTPVQYLLSYVFGLGLLLMFVSASCYLLNIDLHAAVFVAGMAACCISALASCLAGERGAKLEDFITMAVGAAFFSWMAFKAMAA